MNQQKEDRSIGELFAQLAKETSTLVRQEVTLAKTEMSQKASEVGKQVGFLAVGGAVAYAGLLAIIAAIVIALASLGLPWWLSALIVGVVVAAVGYFLVQRGLSALKRQNMAPQQTIDTIKEDAEWVKEQVR
ncbi:MAG: phage holin family protein [Chloroflexota bacterium]